MMQENPDGDRDRAVYGDLDGARSAILDAIREAGSTVTLADLAAELSWVEPWADQSRGRIRTRLHHVDLPLLDDLGLVEYDHERNVATPVETHDNGTVLP